MEPIPPKGNPLLLPWGRPFCFLSRGAGLTVGPQKVACALSTEGEEEPVLAPAPAWLGHSPVTLCCSTKPTPHLDVLSQEVLRQAMAKWEGTIVTVSHNRWFVNGFVNRVLEIPHGRARVLEGTRG